MRTILTTEPHMVADTLFQRYVERQFAQPNEYQEAVMARRYFDALRLLRPGQAFERDRNIGTPGYHVRIPICSRGTADRGIPLRVLKPLDLVREDPTSIIDHGDAWIGRVRRLKEIGYLPERFVFAVRAQANGLAGQAAQNIIEKLHHEGVITGDAADIDQIVALTAD